MRIWSDLGRAVVSILLPCCYVGGSGGCSGVAACERVPDGEVNEKAFLAHETPTLYIELRRQKARPGELRDDLFTS